MSKWVRSTWAHDVWEQMWRLSASLALLSWTWNVVTGEHLRNVSSQPLLPWCFHEHPLSLAFFLFVFSGVFCWVTRHKWTWWNAKCYAFSHIPKGENTFPGGFPEVRTLQYYVMFASRRTFIIDKFIVEFKDIWHLHYVEISHLKNMFCHLS